MKKMNEDDASPVPVNNMGSGNIADPKNRKLGDKKVLKRKSPIEKLKRFRSFIDMNPELIEKK